MLFLQLLQWPYPVNVLTTHSTQMQLVWWAMLPMDRSVIRLFILQLYGCVLGEVQLWWLQVLLQYIDVELMPRDGLPEPFHRLLVQLCQVSSVTLGQALFATSIARFQLLIVTAFTFIYWLLQQIVLYDTALNRQDMNCCLAFFK